LEKGRGVSLKHPSHNILITRLVLVTHLPLYRQRGSCN